MLADALADALTRGTVVSPLAVSRQCYVPTSERAGVHPGLPHERTCSRQLIQSSTSSSGVSGTPPPSLMDPDATLGS